MVLIAQRMLNEDTAENAQGVAVLEKLGVLKTVHTIKWGEGVNTGVVEIESADDKDYAGTWNPVQTVTFSGTAPKIDAVPIEGSFAVMRHRISTIVEDGSVTSRIDGSA